MLRLLAVLLLWAGVSAFGQIDATIPLRVNPPQTTNPLDIANRAQALRLAQQQQELNRLAIEKRQRELAQQQAARSPSLGTAQVRVEERMTAAEFQASGLKKLSPEELAMLNHWLSVKLAETVTAVREQDHPITVATAMPAPANQTKALLLYGGEDHKTFLGCLNCANTSPSSTCNKYGSYGSRYENNSIWNPYGEYGSKYNSSSPWNKYSSEAPIIVDSDGSSYGYFSANEYHHDRTRLQFFVSVLKFESKEEDLEKTRDAMCEEN